MFDIVLLNENLIIKTNYSMYNCYVIAANYLITFNLNIINAIDFLNINLYFNI